MSPPKHFDHLHPHHQLHNETTLHHPTSTSTLAPTTTTSLLHRNMDDEDDDDDVNHEAVIGDTLVGRQHRDDVPVLACENGSCSVSVQPLPAKKAQYLKTLHCLPLRLCGGCCSSLAGGGLRCREVLILAVGMSLTCVALGLIVAGALRSEERGGSRSAFLHVSSLLKHLSTEDASGMTASDQIFTFEQLLLLNNYALNKPTQQSSVFLEVLDIPELDGESDFAVDGSVSTCARTDPENHPFWYVDMGQIEHIRSLRLYGSDANRLHDLEVYVGNSENVTENVLCTRRPGNPHVLDVRIVCDKNLRGRYIGIIMRTQPGKPESLIICEALVYLM